MLVTSTNAPEVESCSTQLCRSAGTSQLNYSDTISAPLTPGSCSPVLYSLVPPLAAHRSCVIRVVGTCGCPAPRRSRGCPCVPPRRSFRRSSSTTLPTCGTCCAEPTPGGFEVVGVAADGSGIGLATHGRPTSSSTSPCRRGGSALPTLRRGWPDGRPPSTTPRTRVGRRAGNARCRWPPRRASTRRTAPQTGWLSGDDLAGRRTAAPPARAEARPVRPGLRGPAVLHGRGTRDGAVRRHRSWPTSRCSASSTRTRSPSGCSGPRPPPGPRSGSPHRPSPTWCPTTGSTPTRPSRSASTAATSGPPSAAPAGRCSSTWTPPPRTWACCAGRSPRPPSRSVDRSGCSTGSPRRWPGPARTSTRSSATG